MGGTITHLVIADKIMNILPAGVITDAGMFYAGSLAPDAIHARHGYVRAMKKHTHMRDDIWDQNFLLPENIKIFHNRLKTFIDSNRHRKGATLDAYRGYVAHLLSDEIFVMTARQKLVDKVAKEGIGQRDREFLIKFAPEVHNNDLILSKAYPSIEKIKESLEAVGPFEIKDYITPDELRNSRQWVIKNFLKNPRKPDQPLYITPKDIEDYINQSVEYVIDYIFK